MGVIIKQSLIGTLYSYIGVILGLITAAFLLPQLLSTEEVGLVKVLVSYSILFAGFGVLGFGNVINKLFPLFRDEKNGHNGFFAILLAVGTLGSLITLGVFFLIKPMLIADSIDKAPEFVAYINYLIPLIIFPIFYTLFDVYSSALYISAIGTLLKDVVQRILIIISLGLYFFDIITFHSFIITYTISYCIPTLLIIISLIKEKAFILKPQKDFLTPDLKRNILSVASFSLLSGFAGLLIANIDTIMIKTLVGLSGAGIYSITFFFGQLVRIPSRSVIRISNIVIADAWKINDIETIKIIYYKSCLNQLIMGLFIFMCIWVNIDSIFEILPDKYAAGKWVIFFIGLNNLIDMLSGVNGSVINTSKYYRYQTMFMGLLILLVIGSNYILIPRYGITGAAIASAISLTTFNFCRYIFLYFAYKMQPYNWRHLLIIAIGLSSYYLVNLLPK